MFAYGSWPIQRDKRNDVLEAVRPHVDKRAAHAGTFHLEHADHFTAREHLVTLGVVERQCRQIDVNAALLQQLHRDVEHASASSGRGSRI